MRNGLERTFVCTVVVCISVRRKNINTDTCDILRMATPYFSISPRGHDVVLQGLSFLQLNVGSSNRDSRGIFDALTRSESPQLRLRSSRTGEEARGNKEQCAVSDARIHWVNTSTMLADSLTKTRYPARAEIESFMVKKRWRCTFDPTFESGRRRKARGAP